MIRECQWLQVATLTTSKSLSSGALRMSWTHFGVLPVSRATACAAGKHPLVGINEVRNLDILHSAELRDMLSAAAPDAGHGHVDRLIGPEDLARAFRAGNREGVGDERQCRGPGRSLFEERTRRVWRNMRITPCGKKLGFGGSR